MGSCVPSRRQGTRDKGWQQATGSPPTSNPLWASVPPVPCQACPDACSRGHSVASIPQRGLLLGPWLLKVDRWPKKALKWQRGPGGTWVSAKYRVTSSTPSTQGAYGVPPGREREARPPNQPLLGQGTVLRACGEQRDQQGCCGEERGPRQGGRGMGSLRITHVAGPGLVPPPPISFLFFF